jgi:hypothetical protein
MSFFRVLFFSQSRFHFVKRGNFMKISTLHRTRRSRNFFRHLKHTSIRTLCSLLHLTFFNKTIQFYPKHSSNYRSKKDRALARAIVGFMISFEDGVRRLPTSDFQAVGLTINYSSYLQRTKNYETQRYGIFLILLSHPLS